MRKTSKDKAKLELNDKLKQISELYVVIDTLQTNLMAAVSYLNEEQKAEVENHSYKWCSAWRPGDERGK
jgi:hypothetical protein